ncbi:heme biosynthesis protein HemY [Oceanibacterium hippocampi]|uniref:Tetratricopeptide repeat protein n=1 Tax=Oceanibacterium hippocampi TaxID=745714 RepID=A0A1Y5RDZ5_9PROT|nr:heme biosynthesis HemY N-terminal domain-containing protein [Oceanibacterium hippocampi]SLN15210.1 tetratricopeptide repeat protein [Oceanibacterium hippocampi]
MLRLLLIFVAVVLLSLGAAWFAENPGHVVIDWQGYRIDTYVAVAGLLAIAIVVVVAMLYLVWRWFRTRPGSFLARRSEKRRRKGFSAFTTGLVAIAAGDAEGARRSAVATEKMLADEPLALLLAAQAAELNNDDRAAKVYYEKMLDNPETEFLGVRGLFGLARRKGDQDEAVKLVRRAYRLQPNTPWVLKSLFRVQTVSGDWAAAEETLARAERAKLVTSEEASRRNAVLLLCQAEKAETDGDRKHAVKLAGSAHKLAPSLVPATVLLARLHKASGKERKAASLLAEAWTAAPHPAYAEAFMALYPAASAEERLKQLQSGLTAGNPDHAESRLAIAEAAIAAGDWTAARAALEALDEEQSDSRFHRLMASLDERQNGDAEAAREWLAKGAEVAVEPSWVCGNCDRHSGEWRPVCPSCGAFDSFHWQDREPVTAELLPAGGEDRAALPYSG